MKKRRYASLATTDVYSLLTTLKKWENTLKDKCDKIEK